MEIKVTQCPTIRHVQLRLLEGKASNTLFIVIPSDKNRNTRLTLETLATLLPELVVVDAPSFMEEKLFPKKKVFPPRVTILALISTGIDFSQSKYKELVLVGDITEIPEDEWVQFMYRW